ncbi:MAG: hypothetical protein KIT85_01095 [Pseudolabrys sp.]|nr:hypothetical protein [Pseudolabrys sp.]
MPRRASLRLKARARLLAESVSADLPISSPADSDPPDLKASLRLLYEQSSLTVREIAVAAGLSERAIYNRARNSGWSPRERRVPGALTMLDPAAAQRIAGRVRQVVDLTDAAAARALNRAHVARATRDNRRTVDADLKTVEMLGAALIDLARCPRGARCAPLARELAAVIAGEMRRVMRPASSRLCKSVAACRDDPPLSMVFPPVNFLLPD